MLWFMSGGISIINYALYEADPVTPNPFDSHSLFDEYHVFTSPE